MILYDCKLAPSPRRARIFAAEKGIVLETIEIDLGNGEQLSEMYRSINPRCTVPALKLDDGTILAENIAIADYLEAIVPEPPLIGSNPLQRARTLELNYRIEMEGLMAIAEILRNSSPGMKDRALTGPNNYTQIPELAERGRARFQNFFPMLEQQLGDHQFLLGDHFTMADITAFVVTEFATWVKESVPAHCTGVQAWYQRVKARPSAEA
jgi:glutathione S-transferase